MFNYELFECNKEWGMRKLSFIMKQFPSSWKKTMLYMCFETVTISRKLTCSINHSGFAIARKSMNFMECNDVQ